MNEFYLGIDGGGTKTVALIADKNGNEISRASAGGCGYKAVGLEQAKKALHEAVNRAFSLAQVTPSGIIKACFGVADCDTAEDVSQYKNILQSDEIFGLPVEKISIVNDTKIALFAGAEEGWGVVLIAGTGSNCYGRTEEGEEASCGGMDWLLSDEGSAYELGVKTLRAVLQEYDGRGKPTLLTKLCLAELKKQEVSEIFNWVYRTPFSKKNIAQLAPLVGQAYDNQDEVSDTILQESIESLSVMGTTVIKKLGMQKRVFSFVLSGGVYNIGEFFIERITQNIQTIAPQANVFRLEKDPVWGAITIAQKGID